MDQPLLMRMPRVSTLLAVLALLAPIGLEAQTGTVTGRVVDATTAQPIAAAQVSIAGTGVGTLSQQNGRFTLSNVPVGTHTINVQLIGYRTVSEQITVVAGQTLDRNFSLSQQALALDEIIVTGTPGGTQRRAIGNSVARVQASQITEQAPIAGVQELLAGRTPGLRFGRQDGQVGGGSGITIRGVSSVLLGNQPLIYIDGVRIDNDATRGPNTGNGANSSAMNDLNPDEIESIEVIKGPAAATLYGTEASAGVIQIITKKGRVGAPEFTAEVALGTNFMWDPASILGTQYGCKVNVTQCPEDQIVAVNLYDEANDYLRHQGRFAGLDLPFPARDEDLFQSGHSRRFNLSARGGTDQVRYFLSGSFGDDMGIVDYNTDRSTNMRANVTVLLSESLNLDISTGYGQGKSRFATIRSEGGAWHQLVWGRPTNLPGVRSEKGSGFLGFQERWPQDYENTNIAREYSRFTGSATTTHSLGDWLTQRLVFGVDRVWDTNTEYLPGGSNFPVAPNGYLRYGKPIEQNVTLDYATSARYRPVNAIGTTTSVGVQYYYNHTESVENFGTGFPTPVQTVIDQTDFSSRQVSYTSIQNKSLGLYVQEEVSWNDRLYLTGAVRADDNSAFGSEFDLQYYPKLSASWVLSEEPFFTVPAINNLRLRSAWGRSGRQPGTFASQTLYGTMLGPNGNGLLPTTAGNPEIGPEVSTELEVGVDVSAFDERISGEFNLYRTKTRDMLVNQSLAPSTGLTGTRQANLGTLEVRGWEAQVNARVFQTRNIAFDLTLSGDHTENEIVSLGEDILPTGNFQIGWPFPNIASNYILRSAELNAQGNPIRATAMCDGGRPAVDGGPNIMQGGETIPCTEFSSAGLLLGPTYPYYTWSVAPTVTLRNNLQVFALAEGQYGRWIASTDADFACRVYSSCLTAVKRTDAMWVTGISTFSDDRYRGRYPADFWKLRQVGLRYTLPAGIVRRVGGDRASISVSASNLKTLWQKTKTDLAGNPIYDPEYSNNGSNPSQTALWELPGITRINASLRVSF